MAKKKQVAEVIEDESEGCIGCKHAHKKSTDVPCCDCKRRFDDYYEKEAT